VTGSVDPPGADADPVPGAPAQPLRVVIEFEPGTEVVGSLRDGDKATPFRGRLELYAALERARETGAPTP
jgi:hypothetical protein